MSDLELFVVTGRPGERALRWMPLDEAVERMTSVPLRLFDESNAAVRVSRERAADLLRAALGEDT